MMRKMSEVKKCFRQENVQEKCLNLKVEKMFGVVPIRPQHASLIPQAHSNGLSILSSVEQ